MHFLKIHFVVLTNIYANCGQINQWFIKSPGASASLSNMLHFIFKINLAMLLWHLPGSQYFQNPDKIQINRILCMQITIPNIQIRRTLDCWLLLYQPSGDDLEQSLLPLASTNKMHNSTSYPDSLTTWTHSGSLSPFSIPCLTMLTAKQFNQVRLLSLTQLSAFVLCQGQNLGFLACVSNTGVCFCIKLWKDWLMGGKACVTPCLCQLRAWCWRRGRGRQRHAQTWSSALSANLGRAPLVKHTFPESPP